MSRPPPKSTRTYPLFPYPTLVGSIGGVPTINLNGGPLDGVAVTASATGIGGFGATGDDADPANPIAPGDGGDGEGGTATVNIDGTAVVTVASDRKSTRLNSSH